MIQFLCLHWNEWHNNHRQSRTSTASTSLQLFPVARRTSALTDPAMLVESSCCPLPSREKRLGNDLLCFVGGFIESHGVCNQAYEMCMVRFLNSQAPFWISFLMQLAIESFSTSSSSMTPTTACLLTAMSTKSYPNGFFTLEPCICLIRKLCFVSVIVADHSVILVVQCSHTSRLLLQETYARNQHQVQEAYLFFT